MLRHTRKLRPAWGNLLCALHGVLPAAVRNRSNRKGRGQRAAIPRPWLRHHAPANYPGGKREDAFRLGRLLQYGKVKEQWAFLRRAQDGPFWSFQPRALRVLGQCLVSAYNARQLRHFFILVPPHTLALHAVGIRLDSRCSI